MPITSVFSKLFARNKKKNTNKAGNSNLQPEREDKKLGKNLEKFATRNAVDDWVEIYDKDSKKTMIANERKRIEKLFNDFSGAIDAKDSKKIEKYLSKMALIFENEVDKFIDTPKEERNSLDSKILSVNLDSIKAMPGLEFDNILGMWSANAGVYGDATRIQKCEDHDYSIFGSCKLNNLIKRCNDKFVNWRKQNSVGEMVEYRKNYTCADGNRAMMGLKHLLDGVGRVLNSNDKEKIREDVNMFSGYINEIFHGLTMILDQIKKAGKLEGTKMGDEFGERNEFLKNGMKVFPQEGNSKESNSGKK